MLDGMSDSIQRSSIENLHSREVDRQSPTGLILIIFSKKPQPVSKVMCLFNFPCPFTFVYFICISRAVPEMTQSITHFLVLDCWWLWKSQLYWWWLWKRHYSLADVQSDVLLLFCMCVTTFLHWSTASCCFVICLPMCQWGAASSRGLWTCVLCTHSCINLKIW